MRTACTLSGYRGCCGRITPANRGAVFDSPAAGRRIPGRFRPGRSCGRRGGAPHVFLPEGNVPQFSEAAGDVCGKNPAPSEYTVGFGASSVRMYRGKGPVAGIAEPQAGEHSDYARLLPQGLSLRSGKRRRQAVCAARNTVHAACITVRAFRSCRLTGARGSACCVSGGHFRLRAAVSGSSAYPRSRPLQSGLIFFTSAESSRSVISPFSGLPWLSSSTSLTFSRRSAVS